MISTKKSCNVLVAISLFLLFPFWTTVSANEVHITVAQSGTGDYKSIGEAITSLSGRQALRCVIYIKNGIYKEKLVIPKDLVNLTLKGQDVNKTIITFDDYASKKDSSGKNIGTFGSSSVFVYADNFTAKNITFQNSSGPVGQAVAISVGGDRSCFKNCRFLGFQDTVYTFGNTARQYFLKCYIEGTVDFIFGAATAIFDRCEIFCKKGGYITAASTPEGQRFGYVFLRCKITGNASANSFYLGRPWRPYAHVVFLKSRLPALIKAEGWHNWGKEENEHTAIYREYKNQGEGFVLGKRVKWSTQITRLEAKKYSIKNIFGDWKPCI